MSSQYFEKWSWGTNSLVGPLSDAEARARHAGGQPYVATLEVGGGSCVVDFGGDWVSVLFLDERRRVFLNYDFKRLEPGRLFLASCRYREFAGAGDDVEKTTRFKFATDGNIEIYASNLKSSTEEERHSKADPSVNWESYPQFGDYVALCRIDRLSPVADTNG